MNNHNTHHMIAFIILLSAALFASLIVLFFSFYAPLREENKRMQRRMDYHNSTYLHQCGWTSFMGGKDGIGYDLYSWDAGRNWYAVDRKTTGDSFIILGKADVIYPDLLKHLEAVDKLTEYTVKNGSIGSKGKIADEEIKMLTDSGFEVKQKNKN